ELAEARAVVAALGLALLPASWRLTGGRAPAPVLALGLCIALVNAAYYIAIDRLPVAVAIVLQYTAPAMVVAWTALAARRGPSREVLLALGTALAGVLLVSGVVGADVGRADALGLAAGLASGVLFASYTLVGERVVAAYGAVAGLFRAFLIASVLWLGWQATQGWPAELFEPAHLGRALYVGLAATLAPFLLYVWGIQHVRAARAAIAATLEPVLAGLVAWAWLGQALEPVQVLGGVLVMGAVVLIQSRRRTRVPAPGV
ncbi:MAG: EamA family transporter, partial [Actinomycetota bacterium]